MKPEDRAWRGACAWRVGVLLVACCTWLASPFAQDAPVPAEPAGVRRALLIGINSYESRDVPGLLGCVNDIEAMQSLLTGRWQFDADHITMLKNDEASRDGILAAFDTLAGACRPEDTVIIHYAGHGSQVEDLDGDEDDGLDETLVASDSRTKDVPDITDDELHDKLAALSVRSLVVILDCCHSGTGTRDLGVRQRRIERDSRADLYAKRPVRTRAVVPVQTEPWITMTGAARDQSALDGPIEGRYHGAFSFAVIKSLSSAPREASPLVVLQDVEGELRNLGELWKIAAMPEPQLEGPRDLMEEPILLQSRAADAASAGAAIARLAWVPVEAGPDASTIFFDAGAQDALPGALWAIYPPGETAFNPGAQIATARVAAVEGDRARAVLEMLTAPVASGARAILLAPPPSGGRIAIRFPATLDPEVTSPLTQMLRERVPGLVVVTGTEFATLTIDVQDEQCLVMGADGVTVLAVLTPDSVEALVDGLVKVIERCLLTFDLIAVDNPASAMQLEIRVGPPIDRKQTSVGQRGLKVVADTGPPALHVWEDGTPRSASNHLQVSVRASADCYLSIVDIDAEGALTLLFPNADMEPGFHPDGLLMRDAWSAIPDSFQADNEAGFHWPAGAPEGLDTVRVFACTSLADAEAIRGVVREASRLAVGTGTRDLADKAPVRRADLLRKLSHRLAYRGFKVTADESGRAEPATSASSSGDASGSDWTAASITVRVIR